MKKGCIRYDGFTGCKINCTVKSCALLITRPKLMIESALTYDDIDYCSIRDVDSQLNFNTNELIFSC